MMVKKLFAAVLCISLCLMCMAGCSNMGDLVSGTPVGEFPVEINGVTISAKPQKVVVLSPSLADVVLALDCETQLLAGAQGCTQEGLGSSRRWTPGTLRPLPPLARTWCWWTLPAPGRSRP